MKYFLWFEQDSNLKKHFCWLFICVTHFLTMITINNICKHRLTFCQFICGKVWDLIQLNYLFIFKKFKSIWSASSWIIFGFFAIQFLNRFFYLDQVFFNIFIFIHNSFSCRYLFKKIVNCKPCQFISCRLFIIIDLLIEYCNYLVENLR